MGAFLSINYSRFQCVFNSSDTPYDVMQHPFLYYVDEQNYTWSELQMFDWERIAYVKCFESDFIGDDTFTRLKNNLPNGFSLSKLGNGDLKIPENKTPVIISIYTRKDKDFRTMPGGLNRIKIKGYTPIIRFHPDATTLFWDPFLFSNRLRIHFSNNEGARHFRVVINGVNINGEVVRFQTVLP